MRSSENTVTWEGLYKQWEMSIMQFPELQGSLEIRKVEIKKPEFGPTYRHNWVDKRNEDALIQEDLRIEASTWQEIGSQWSKGTLTTAALLSSCRTQEELAAVWIGAFALALQKRSDPHDAFHYNAIKVENAACSVFAPKYGYWHHSSNDFFPELYIPHSLLWDGIALLPSTIVELAAMNAALVMAHFTPVEYTRGHS